MGGTAGAEHRGYGGPGGAGESRTLIPVWLTRWPTALAREGQLREMMQEGRARSS